ncbi:hypothetical protein L3X38_011689 [Prunus dulcis]|uniref:F-box domain-containing protein n=1 Tax=Prunus dulcis TaxID=3755 RepID=A0AAD4WIN3_PRUDU|nr:hypothetical protein L3X38_011689 [Prunus dulcis]
MLTTTDWLRVHCYKLQSSTNPKASQNPETVSKQSLLLLLLLLPLLLVLLFDFEPVLAHQRDRAPHVLQPMQVAIKAPRSQRSAVMGPAAPASTATSSSKRAAVLVCLFKREDGDPHVDARTLGMASCVNKQWHKTVQDERLWELICTRHWVNSGCGNQQLRSVVLALGGFRRLHSHFIWPLSKPSSSSSSSSSSSASPWASPLKPMLGSKPSDLHLRRAEPSLGAKTLRSSSCLVSLDLIYAVEAAWRQCRLLGHHHNHHGRSQKASFLHLSSTASRTDPSLSHSLSLSLSLSHSHGVKNSTTTMHPSLVVGSHGYGRQGYGS